MSKKEAKESKTMVPFQNTANYQSGTQTDVTVLGDDEIELRQYAFDDSGAIVRCTQTASVQQLLDLIGILSQAVSAALTPPPGA